MAQKKSIVETKEAKLLKSLGAADITQEGGKVSLTIDTAKLSSGKRRSLAGGLSRATAAGTLYSNPMDSQFFDPTSRESDGLTTHEKIKMAMQHFDKDPLVGKIIEMMKVFANDGFKNEHKNKKIKQFYDNWCYEVDMDLVLSWAFLEYFRSGNVVTIRELAPFTENTFDFPAPQYSVEGAILSNADAAKKNLYSKKSIPIAYMVLNPLTVFVDKLNGYQDELYFSSRDSKVKLKDDIDVNSLLISKLPAKLRERIGKTGKIPLNEKNVSRILRMRQPYESYGKVLCERAFNALHEKNKLRQMDMSMVNSVINQIIKVTVGNDDYPATPHQLKQLAQAFQNVGKSQMIFWNHTLNIEVIRPDTKVLNMDKYERVNEDIRNAFGISEVIMGGGTSKTNFATAYLTLKVFITNLMDARKDVLRWLRSEYEDIAEAMGFDSIPEPSFNNLSLTDEVAEKQLIMQMVDRGIISYQSAQSRLGYDPEIEVARRKEELPLMQEGILGFAGSPYQQTAEKEIIDTDEESDENVKKEDKQTVDDRTKKESQQNRAHTKTKGDPRGVPNKGAQGRPKTPRGKSIPKRAVSPKGSASEIGDEDQITVFDEIERQKEQTEIVLKVAGAALNK